MGPSEIVRRKRRACARKLKLDFEQAAERFGRYPSDCHIYHCEYCQHLHFGHQAVWDRPKLIEKQKKAAKKEEHRKYFVAPVKIKFIPTKVQVMEWAEIDERLNFGKHKQQQRDFDRTQGAV